MGRILHCLLWAVLATSSAYKSNYNNFDYSNYGYYPDYPAPYRPSYNHRHDWPGPHRHGHERISERSTETNEFGERTNSHISENASEEYSNRETNRRDSERTNGEFSNNRRDSERTNGEFSNRETNRRDSERKNGEFSNREHDRDARTNQRGVSASTNERILTNERVSPRMNERSIEVASSIQRVQQQERKRHQTREEPRAEEGSYKILNKTPLPHKRGTAEDRVVFPDDYSDYKTSNPRVQTRSSGPSFLDNLPESCQKLGICDDLPDEEAYNSIVDGALRMYADPRNLKSIDELDSPGIAQRLHSDVDLEKEMKLCSSQERVMMPKAAKDKDDKWHILLNRNPDPIQGYRVEICDQKPGSNCTSGIFHFYKGYTGYCQQKFSFRPMTAVNPSTNTTYTVALRVPSCCSCVAMQV